MKKEYLHQRLFHTEHRTLDPFERTARVVSIVAESLHHWENQVNDYGDLKILANYLYEHVRMPAIKLRMPVDMLVIMLDHHHESLQMDSRRSSMEVG